MVTALKEKSHFKYTYHCSQPIFCFLQPTALLSVILKNKIMTKLIKDNTLEEHYLNPKFHLYSWYKEDKCISRKGSGICNCFDQYVWTRLSKAQIYQWARIFFGQSSHCVVTQRAHTSRLRANASALYSELRCAHGSSDFYHLCVTQNVLHSIYSLFLFTIAYLWLKKDWWRTRLLSFKKKCILLFWDSV